MPRPMWSQKSGVERNIKRFQVHILLKSEVVSAVLASQTKWSETSLWDTLTKCVGSDLWQSEAGHFHFHFGSPRGLTLCYFVLVEQSLHSSLGNHNQPVQHHTPVLLIFLMSCFCSSTLDQRTLLLFMSVLSKEPYSSACGVGLEIARIALWWSPAMGCGVRSLMVRPSWALFIRALVNSKDERL